VCIIECKPSKEICTVVWKNDQFVFVRRGPRTDKLSASEIIKLSKEADIVVASESVTYAKCMQIKKGATDKISATPLYMGSPCYSKMQHNFTI